MSRPTIKSGIWDPSLFESNLGLSFVVDMLNPDNHIKFVSFQKDDYETIDDVVVRYGNKEEKCFQVKHQILGAIPESVTFDSLIRKEPGKTYSLLEAFYRGWIKAKKLYPNIKHEPILFTNKKLEERPRTRIFAEKSYKAYTLPVFISKVHRLISNKKKGQRLVFRDKTLETQWREMVSCLPSSHPSEILNFIASFRVESVRLSLQESDRELKEKIQQAFHCGPSQADLLFGRLFTACRNWYSQGRGSDRVTAEEAYEALSAGEDLVIEQQMKLSLPRPFFKSRVSFANALEKKLKSTDKKIVFLTGAPGCGKTSLSTFLDLRKGLFAVRYYTYKPISPDQHFLNGDSGISEEKTFWSTILSELRFQFKGELLKLKIPVLNAFCTPDSLFSESMRLLGILGKRAQEKGQRIFVCVDGIDHAARAGDSLAFLRSLPSPENIPDGVCFLLVGQPFSLYSDRYPLWLNDAKGVETVQVPNLTKSDVQAFVRSECPSLPANDSLVSRLILNQTNGNNLSVVYSVHSIKKCTTEEQALALLKNSPISQDVEEYYRMIWDSCGRKMTQSFPSTNNLRDIVASAIVLLNGSVDSSLLAEYLPFTRITQAEWSSIFASLSPLMVAVDQKPGQFLILHNDFRLFLLAIARNNYTIYQDVALQIARALLETAKGQLTYEIALDLLEKAGEDRLIPAYFSTDYVIGSFAYGIPESVLCDRADKAYRIACSYKDKKSLFITYLGIKTLSQHHSFTEYYGNGLSEFEKTITGGLTFLPKKHLVFQHSTLEAYEEVLRLSFQRFQEGDEDANTEAKSYYFQYFKGLTPSSCLPFAKSERGAGILDEDVELFLKKWGRFLADTGFSIPSFYRPRTSLRAQLTLCFGDAYFDEAFQKEHFQDCLIALHKNLVSLDGFGEKISTIYYRNLTAIFADYLPRFIERNSRNDDRLFAMVCLLREKGPASLGSFSAEVENSREGRPLERPLYCLLKAYVIGAKEKELDDSIICSHATRLSRPNFLDTRDVDPTIDLARSACLLAKYSFSTSHPSEALLNAVRGFLFDPSEKPFGFFETNKFWLSILLFAQERRSLFAEQEFVSLLQLALNKLDARGMAFKTIILDYLLAHGHNDAVRDYIHHLFGSLGELLFQDENPTTLYQIFGSYCKIVDPALEAAIANTIRWKTVGYTDYKEIAFESPFNSYCDLSKNHPEVWESVGKRLFNQALNAEQSTNEYSMDVRVELAKNAGQCGIQSLWRFHLWDKELAIDSQALSSGILGLLHLASSYSDLEVLWILSTGLFSWYDSSDVAALYNLYPIFSQSAKCFGTIFEDKLRDLTPGWWKLIQAEGLRRKKTEDIPTTPSRQNSNFSEMNVTQIKECIGKVTSSFDAISLHKEAVSSFKTRKIFNRENCLSLLPSLCKAFESYGWINQSCESLIQEYYHQLGDDAFWAFANSLKKNLSEYFFQTSERNIGSLFWMDDSLDFDSKKRFCEWEIETQEQWSTGCGHLPLRKNNGDIISPFPTPKNLQEFSLYLLLELIGTRKGKRTESALASLWKLMVLCPSIVGIFPSIFPHMSAYQRHLVFLALFRWVKERRDLSGKALELIENEYRRTHRLTEKYLLHSILLSSDKKGLYRDISFEQEAQIPVLPKSGPAIVTGIPKNFLSATEINSGENDDVRRYVCSFEAKEIEEEESYSNDCLEPNLAHEIDCCLYDFENRGRWSGTPLLIKKTRLISFDDPYLLTEIPCVNSDSRICEPLEDDVKKKGFGPAERKRCREIVSRQCALGWAVIGSSLYIPVGERDGYFYKEIPYIQRLRSPTLPPMNVRDRDYIGDYSLFLSEERGQQHGHDQTGWLFLENVGWALFHHSSCDLIPSSLWEEVFHCAPSIRSPLVWENANGSPVLRFERIAFLSRDTVRESYYRQPFLFRWVCDKKWLFDECSKKALTIETSSFVKQID